MLRATTEHAEHAQKASRESAEFLRLFQLEKKRPRRQLRQRDSTRKAHFVSQLAKGRVRFKDINDHNDINDAPQGATHQLTARSQGSLLVASRFAP